MLVIDRVLGSLRYRTSRFLKRSGLRDGTLETMWIRQVMNSELRGCFEALDPKTAHAMQVGGDYWSCMEWASFESVQLTRGEPGAPSRFCHGRVFDVVICDQVLNQMVDPTDSLADLVRLARTGGTVVVSTPLLVKVDPLPGDLWRFTHEGLALVMERAGLVDVHVDSWGNRRCVTANLRRWVPHRTWRSLRNEPMFPAVVWGWGTPCASLSSMEDDSH